MKQLIICIAFLIPAFAQAQHAYISTNGDIILESGSIEIFDNPDIYCEGSLKKRAAVWVVIVQLTSSGAGAGNIVKVAQINIPEADIDALTCSGSDNSDKTQNCVLQAIKNYLLVLNPSITFTLN